MSLAEEIYLAAVKNEMKTDPRFSPDVLVKLARAAIEVADVFNVEREKLYQERMSKP